MSIVEKLRKAGFKVGVSHIRKLKNGKVGTVDGFNNCYGSTWVQSQLDPKGGTTVVSITTPKNLTVERVAKCSDKDPYNKSVGVSIAAGRALKELGLQVSDIV